MVDKYMERVAKMEVHLDNLKGITSEIQTEIQTMNKILVVNTTQLEIHIEGVRLAREQNDLLREDIDNRFKLNQEDLQPIKDHITFVNKTIKLWIKVLTVLVALPAFSYYTISVCQKLGWMK